MKPVKPDDQVSDTELDLYNTRMAARRYFAGGSVEIVPDILSDNQAPAENPEVKKKVKVLPKKVVKEAVQEEGC